MLGGEKPIDASDRIYELYLILRRRSQELALIRETDLALDQPGAGSGT